MRFHSVWRAWRSDSTAPCSFSRAASTSSQTIPFGSKGRTVGRNCLSLVLNSPLRLFQAVPLGLQGRAVGCTIRLGGRLFGFESRLRIFQAVPLGLQGLAIGLRIPTRRPLVCYREPPAPPSSGPTRFAGPRDRDCTIRLDGHLFGLYSHLRRFQAVPLGLHGPRDRTAQSDSTAACLLSRATCAAFKRSHSVCRAARPDARSDSTAACLLSRAACAAFKRSHSVCRAARSDCAIRLDGRLFAI